PLLTERYLNQRETVLRLHNLSPVFAIAPDAAAPLVEALSSNNNTVLFQAAWILRDLGPSAVPALCAALTHSEPAVRVRAADVLRDLKGHARTAESALRAAMHDPDLDVALASAHALWAIAGEKKAVLPVVRAALAAPEPARRVKALEILRE